jgi:hypothetical protein
MAWTHGRRLLVMTGAALLTGAAFLGTVQPAQANVDPSKPPLDVRITRVNGNTVTLAWNRPANNLSWWIYVYDNNAEEFITDIEQSGATLKRLQSGTTHSFTVIYGDFTEDPAGSGPNFNESAPSALIQVTLPANSDTTPPTAPDNISNEPQGDGSWFLTKWDPSTDDVTPQSKIQYDIINWTGFTQFYGATSGTRDWQASNIRAVDEAGNRSN